MTKQMYNEIINHGFGISCTKNQLKKVKEMSVMYKVSVSELIRQFIEKAWENTIKDKV